MNNYKIYGLFDKNNPNDIRYIGLTKQTLKQRCSKHRTEKYNLYKLNWVNKIGKNNLNIISLIDNLTLEEARENEIRLIKEYKENGFKLTNITNGGEGWLNSTFTDEHKENISKNHADFSGEKNPMYNKKHSEDMIKILSDKAKKWHEEIGYTEEQINNYSNTNKGEKNNKAILTEFEVLNIRKLHSEGETQINLSKMYNIKEPAIWKILNRYTWKHI